MKTQKVKMIKLPFLVADCSCGLFEVKPWNFHAGTWGTFTARTKLYFVHCGGKWWNCLQNVVKFILPTKFTLICFHDYNQLTDRNAVSRESLPDDPALVSCAQRRLCFHFPLKLLAALAQLSFREPFLCPRGQKIVRISRNFHDPSRIFVIEMFEYQSVTGQKETTLVSIRL